MAPERLHPLVRPLGLLVVLFWSAWCAAGPVVESWHTAAGAKVMFVQAPDLPMVDVRVLFDAGSARDGELPGLARFVNAMLNEGAGEWDADALARRVEDRGIRLGNGSLRDMAWASIRSLTEPPVLAVAVDTLASVLARPRFDPDAVERVRQQMQIGLRTSLQSPATLADRQFYESVYGDHPYAHAPDGDEESLARIGRDDLVAFHARYYVAANAVIAIVGALDRGSAEELAEQVVAGLPAGEAAPALPAPTVLGGGESRQPFPSTQTHIYVGQLGMARHDPDYYPLYVGNHVLGGSALVSTLGEEVRNKRGLSYSVASSFIPMRVAGPFVMVAQTRNDQTDEALKVMRETLARFVAEGPSQAELDAAKQNLIGGFPLRIASNAKIIEYVAMMGFYDYPLDYLDTLTGRLAAVTLEQVRDAFSRRIVAPTEVAVIVGGSD